MKILQVNTEKTWRGGERQTLYTLEGLVSKGVECQLMALKDSPMHRKAKQIGIQTITVKNTLDTLYRLAILKGDFDCIHAQTAKAHGHCMVTKIFHRTAVIYTRRVDFVPRGFLTRLKYKLTDKVVSISYAIAAILQQSNMYKQPPIINSAVKGRDLDKKRALSLKKDLNIGTGTKIIGVISALEPHKDPAAVLATARQLHRIRQDFVLLHFGIGSMFNQIAKKAHQLAIDKYYLQMGHHDNVEDYFSIMDVFLMTSKEEGLGSSVLDAFNYNVAVVSTNAGGLEELVNTRGYLCDIGDIQCLTQGISLALDNSEQSKIWVKAAKAYCDQYMGVDLMTDLYIALYQELVNE